MPLDQNKMKEMLDAIILQQSSGTGPQQPSIEELRAAQQQEAEGNKARELANIFGDATAVMSGSRSISPLALKDSAKTNLQKALAGMGQGQVGQKDQLRALVERFKQSSLDERHGKNLVRRDVSLGQGQQRNDQSQQKIEQPSEKTAAEFSKLETIQKEIDSAIKELDVQEGREELIVPATGLLRNLIEGAKALGEEIGISEPDADIAKLRGQIAGFSAEKLREKFGSQVTVSEMDKVKPYIPLPGDVPSLAKSKMKNLSREIVKVLGSRNKKLEQTGRKFNKASEEFEKAKEEATPLPTPSPKKLPTSEADLDTMTDEELEAYLKGN